LVVGVWVTNPCTPFNVRTIPTVMDEIRMVSVSSVF
jgi:hypothetical protein